jgi:hypothetical protein
MSPLASPTTARSRCAVRRKRATPRWMASEGWAKRSARMNRERPHSRTALPPAGSLPVQRGWRPRHRLRSLPPCSAASRVPSLALGGCAALDATCARCRSALVDGVGSRQAGSRDDNTVGDPPARCGQRQAPDRFLSVLCGRIDFMTPRGPHEPGRCAPNIGHRDVWAPARHSRAH